MGVDKPDIRTVIHLDVPYSPEAYLQETGRAGRDGSAVEAALLYSAEDLRFADTLSDARSAAVFDTREPEMTGPLDRRALPPDAGLCPGHEPLPPGAVAWFPRPGADLLRRPGAEPGRGRSADSGLCGQKPPALHHARGGAAAAGCQELRGGVQRPGLLPRIRGTGGWREEEIEEALETLRRRGAIKVLKRGFWKERIVPSSLRISGIGGLAPTIFTP
jgi:hypothetical protein